MATIDSPATSLSLGELINFQHSILTNTNNDDQESWDLSFPYIIRLVTYITFLGLSFLVISLIVKYIKEDCDNSLRRQVGEGESSRLLTKETVTFTYGTCRTEEEQEDIEAGGCSSSSSSEDLYNGKLCVICYDQERNCFFVPCGHCATCSTCAQRVFDGENRNCVICRRLIRKVRKLVTS